MHLGSYAVEINLETGGVVMGFGREGVAGLGEINLVLHSNRTTIFLLLPDTSNFYSL